MQLAFSDTQRMQPSKDGFNERRDTFFKYGCVNNGREAIQVTNRGQLLRSCNLIPLADCKDLLSIRSSESQIRPYKSTTDCRCVMRHRPAQIFACRDAWF